MKVALVTNVPAPYRVPGFNLIHRRLQGDFKVFFCAHTEANRKWNIPPMEFAHEFLQEHSKPGKNGGTEVHNNSDIFKKLKAFNPDIVITGGFNPTMLYAFLYTVLFRKEHIPFSDAWARSEQHLSPIHRRVRRIVFRRSNAFLACSIKGKEYYGSYGLKNDRIFVSHYTISNELFNNTFAYQDRQVDLLFSGQFTERKNPLFFIQVAQLLKARKSDLKIVLLGDGPLRETMLQQLNASGIAYEYPGYARQEDLPAHYGRAKLFLFPTSSDAWGVVANEALAAGTPVMVTPYAGCAGELVIDGTNGFVLPLDATEWAGNCLSLLEDPQKWQAFSREAARIAGQFTHASAANAIIEACEKAIQ